MISVGKSSVRNDVTLSLEQWELLFQSLDLSLWSRSVCVVTLSLHEKQEP